MTARNGTNATRSNPTRTEALGDHVAHALLGVLAVLHQQRHHLLHMRGEARPSHSRRCVPRQHLLRHRRNIGPTRATLNEPPPVTTITRTLSDVSSRYVLVPERSDVGSTGRPTVMLPTHRPPAQGTAHAKHALRARAHATRSRRETRPRGEGCGHLHVLRRVREHVRDGAQRHGQDAQPRSG
jgi:hypothetical protein